MSSIDPDASGRPRRNRWVDLALLLGAVALVAIPLMFEFGSSGEDEEPFAGTDSQATSEIEKNHPDYVPWFTPWFEPGSGEIESGLFALQAAVGGGILGYALGRLHGRRRTRTPQPGPHAGTDQSP